MGKMSKQLLQQCQRHFPGLAWENSGASSCTAKVSSIIFDQALVVYSNGDGDFEVSLQTNIEGSRLSKRLWVGADAIAQAAERWREFAVEAGAVVGLVVEARATQEQALRSHRVLTSQKEEDKNHEP
jgi:hypothetical protein